MGYAGYHTQQTLAFQSHEDAPADPVEPLAKRRRHGQKDGDGDSILALF